MTNEPWAGNKKQGDVISFSLLGDYVDNNPGDAINILSVKFNDKILC